MTVALAGIPAKRESSDTSLSSPTIQDLSAVRVAFFAGDDISSREKYEMPSVRGFGGLYLPHIKTLPKENKGMLYRCQLTPLRIAKQVQPFAMLPPAARENWEKGFIQKNGTLNDDGTYSDKIVNGFMQSDPEATREGTFRTKRSDHQGYRNVFPGNEIREITKRLEPHGAGGVVEITPLKGATQEEIDEAQYFFFPDWDKISANDPECQLPATMRELEDHIKSRITLIASQPFGVQQKYRVIGQEMIQSCQQFRRFYLETFQKNEIIMKDAAAKGNSSASYHHRTEEAMQLLEYRRKDDIISGESSAVDRLARAMEKNMGGDSSLEAQRIELELLKEQNRAKELELQAVAHSMGHVLGNLNEPQLADTDGDGIPDYRDDEPTVFNDPAIRICGQPTASGAPCQRPIKDDATACSHHSA